MKVKLKRILSFIMTVVVVVAVLPQLSVRVNAETATLTNLGYLGTVNIGDKTESGKWFKLYVQGNPVFCLDLGKACHSGDTFNKVSTSTISSDSTDKATVIKAKAGYWYYVKQNESNKAWIVTQCLMWASEEGVTSKSELKKIISQIKDSAGYKTKSADDLYDDIFGGNTKVTCTITKWKSTAAARQELLEIKSGDSKPSNPKYHKVNDEKWLRQRFTIHKFAEDGSEIEGVKFKLTALNYKEMYSYAVEGKNDVSGGADKDGFEMAGVTDKNGTLGFRFTYRIQSKDYYYYNDEDLAGLSKAEKEKLKEDLEEKGYEYPDNLTKTDAYIMVKADLNEQKENIENEYLLEEIDSENTNISIFPEINGVTSGYNGKITRVSNNSFKVVLTGGWYRNDDKTWKDEQDGVYYRDAYGIIVTDKYKKVKVTVEKRDADTKTSKAQGDADLDGAVYRLKGVNKAKIYDDDGNPLGTEREYVIKDGKFQTDYLMCGEEYEIQEIFPGEGYFLNEETQRIKVDGNGYSEVLNIEKTPVATSYEKVMKGQIAITKLMSDGTTGYVPPEANAEFQIYLASAGSYDKAEDTDRDCITTDKDGYAISKKLPYGTYIVHQSGGQKGMEFVKDFTVQITEEGKVYRYTLNDAVLKTYLKVTKKDSRTGKTVLKPGTQYQIYSLEEGQEVLIKQRRNNGNAIEIVDSFVTDKSGVITTYEQLGVGKYRIKEISSANGFHNAKQYVDIEINDKSYKVEYDEKGNSYNVAEIDYFNDETYGQLTIEKRGEILKDAIYDDEGNKKFIYENSYLKDVQFEIYATEDIVTQDNQGTKWFEEGEKVATVITGKGAEFTQNCNGICIYNIKENTGAVTVSLPLGKYTVKEIETNYGYVFGENNEWNLEFTWENQDDVYVFDNTGTTDSKGVLKVVNDRAKADINILKKDAKTNIGVADTKFGFYTKDNIYAADGKVLAKSGELLAVVKTDSAGYAKIETDLPLMSYNYNKDLADNGILNSGDYYFIEQEISDSYYIDDTQIPVHLEYVDAYTPVIKIEKEQINVPTEIEIDKVTLAGSKELAGCMLEITDSYNNQILSWITGDKESIVTTEKAQEYGYTNLRAELNEKGNIIIHGLLHNQEYRLTEKQPADGYATAKSIDFCLEEKADEEGNISTKVCTKNSSGIYEDAPDNKVIMKDDTTKIRFSKLASDTGKLLKGAEYKVYDSDEREVYSFLTLDEDTLIIEGILKINETYTFVESKAPKGYSKAEDIKITIKDTGKIQDVKVTDKKIEKQKKEKTKTMQAANTPQTGIKINMVARIALMIAAGIICYFTFPGRKNKKSKKKYEK